MTLEELQKKNPSVTIYPVTDPCFSEYGKVLTGFDFTECMAVMAHKAIPADGNCYVACDDEMMALPLAETLSTRFYGHMPIEIGYCNGHSTKLNALEYHKGSEIDGAVTDLVLLLDTIKNIHHNTLPSSGVKAFFVPAGTAVELYGTTLHFAPCALSPEGYKCIVVLPAGTNAALDVIPDPLCEEDQLLWMQNKWLIAHAESTPASKGAHVGITGANIEIFY